MLFFLVALPASPRPSDFDPAALARYADVYEIFEDGSERAYTISLTNPWGECRVGAIAIFSCYSPECLARTTPLSAPACTPRRRTARQSFAPYL